MIHKKTQNEASDWIRDKSIWGQGHNLFPRNSRGNLLSLLSQRSLPECGQQEAENCYTTPTRMEGEHIQEKLCIHTDLSYLSLSSLIPLKKVPMLCSQMSVNKKDWTQKNKCQSTKFLRKTVKDLCHYLSWAGALGGWHKESILCCSCWTSRNILGEHTEQWLVWKFPAPRWNESWPQLWWPSHWRSP